MKYLLFALVIFFSIPALAETYKWEDNNGMHFTDNLTSVPKKYRKHAAAEARGDITNDGPEAAPIDNSNRKKLAAHEAREQAAQDAVDRAREALAKIPPLRTSADFGGDGSNSSKDNAAFIKAREHNANVTRERDFRLRQLTLALKNRDGQTQEPDTISADLDAEKRERKERAAENSRKMKDLQLEQRLEQRQRDIQDKIDRINRKLQ